MVLVSEIEKSQRKVDPASIIELDPLTSDQQVEHDHGEGDTAVKIGPGEMHDLVEMVDPGQHGKHRFDNHATIPFAALANLQVVWLPIQFQKAWIREPGHEGGMLFDQVLKIRPIIDIGGIHAPIHDLAQVIEHIAQLGTHDPALVGQAFLANLLLTPSPLGADGSTRCRSCRSAPASCGDPERLVSSGDGC